MATQHYTGVVEIQQVTREDSTGFPTPGQKTAAKEVNEVFKIVVRSPTLEGLRSTLATHLEQVDSVE